MRYLVLATDYDGTLAEHGRVSVPTLSALRRLRETGRRLVLVTGRQLPDLVGVFPQYELFDKIVAENGAVVFDPHSREEILLGEAPPEALIALLEEKRVTPLSVGKVIVATWTPHQSTVLAAILELGLEHQVIFNKGAVMILPSGINKAIGLRTALEGLGISRHNTVAIGDAENDHALLGECELAACVANALPMLKQHADWISTRPRGAGVTELIERLLESDLRELEPRLRRWNVPLGHTEDEALSVHPYGKRILICGSSGSGKSTLASGLLERLTGKGYQFCLIDPEGDFDSLPNSVVIGGPDQVPSADEVTGLLAPSSRSVVVSLLGVPLEARPATFTHLLARLEEHRARFGIPNWIVADEAHHFVCGGPITLPDPVLNLPSGVVLITVHPERLAIRLLSMIHIIIVAGDYPAAALHTFADAHRVARPELELDRLEAGHAILWDVTEEAPPRQFKALPSHSVRRRHQRKYAVGALGEDKSFYFKGPTGTLNLRAHNLMMFLHLAEGIDDETWFFHLRRNDYSNWFRDAVKDTDLAHEAHAVESTPALSAREGRRRIRDAITQRYTLPA